MHDEIEYYDIFQSASYGIIVTDARGLIRHVNDQSPAILRIDVRQHIGEDIAAILPLIGRSAHQCLATGKDIPGHQILGKRAKLILNVAPIIRQGTHYRRHLQLSGTEQFRGFGQEARFLQNPQPPARDHFQCLVGWHLGL